MGNNKRKVRTITIDPKMFISKPFIDCPRCKHKNSFGVLIISRSCYTRRCNECRFDETYSLPPLDKKVIYLDQFVISNIAKALNKDLSKGKKIDDWYLELFSSLDTLSKSQLIICPDSEFQRQESLLYSFKTLKRLYEHLSHGNTMYDLSTIARFQVVIDFKNYIGNKDKNEPITFDDLLSGERNEWQDRLLISIDWKIDPKEIEYYEQYRQKISEDSQQFFDYWKKQKDIKYKDLFIRVASEYGSGIIRNYANITAKYIADSFGQYKLTESDILSVGTSYENVLISNLLNYLPKDWPYEKQFKTVGAYLKSEKLFNVPFNEIKSALWAAIEYQIITGGRKSPPNTGMTNDIEMVSAFLPYMDSIFVDNDVRSLLKFGEVKKIVSKYKAEIFSPSNKDEFFRYLKNIEKTAPEIIKKKVLEVYGEDFIKPFYELYEQ